MAGWADERTIEHISCINMHHFASRRTLQIVKADKVKEQRRIMTYCREIMMYRNKPRRQRLIIRRTANTVDVSTAYLQQEGMDKRGRWKHSEDEDLLQGVEINLKGSRFFVS
jgi:hypothetical protein